MKILEYEFSNRQWKINKVAFQKTNLIVGDSGTGKTRLMNTIFNLGTYVAQRKINGGQSQWKILIEANKNKYHWSITTDAEDDDTVIQHETLYFNDNLILERNGLETTLQGVPLHKLPRNEISISALREDDLLKPLYDGFSSIMRRKFFTDVLEENSKAYVVNQQLLDKKIGVKKDLFELYKMDLTLNPKLNLLSSYFPEIYEKIIIYYKDAFPFISDIKILDSSKTSPLGFAGSPVFCIREASVDKWIPLEELSSGMQKVLLILTDIFTLPTESIYMIDEYENSLGVNAINVLPSLLFSEDIDSQIFITSHHPYIISKFPVANWYVAHRKGPDVKFSYGEELIKKYNVSSQDKYIQLLNDPIYSEGIE